MIAATLLLAWQAVAVTEMHDRRPTACVLRYTDGRSAPVISVEKRRTRKGRVLTELAVSGRPVISAHLVTATQDTAGLLSPVPPRNGESFRAAAALEGGDAGASLIHELAVSGGRVRIELAGGRELVQLPAPLPHRVVGSYLGCAGDLAIDQAVR